jgi:hypothetical protein
VNGLQTYVSARVRELTHEVQTPTLALPLTVPDFLLARVKPVSPLHRRWWLWTAVSVAAIGIVGGALGGSRFWEPRLPELVYERPR